VGFKYTTHLTKPGETPQSKRIPGREGEMSANAAGGYAFDLDDWARLERFLVLGTEGGTYYAAERELTVESARVVERCVLADGPRSVGRIEAISISGVAPKNDAAILALAIAAKRGDEVTRKLAFAALPGVCRTGTHLFQFAAYVDALGGWGRGARTAVGRWYSAKGPDLLGYQLVKYRQRNGWAHSDLLRLSHPRPTGQTAALLAFAANKPVEGELPRVVEGYLKAAQAATPAESANLVREYQLPRECVRTEHLGEPAVLEALLEPMPLTALVRNLGNLTAAGVVAPFSDATKLVADKLSDIDHLRRSRLHPMTIFLALATYASGRGARGSGAWTPVQQIVDALDAAFYAAAANVIPTGKRLLVAIDVSGSMQAPVMGAPVSAAEAAAAMALVLARTEPGHVVLGVNTGPVELRISPKMRLDAAMNTVRQALGGGTDLSVPARWLAAEGMAVDAVVTLTDNETWAGRSHPAEAMAAYRRQVGAPVRNLVAAMSATQHSVADPADPLTLQCIGLDASIPEVVRGFVNAEF
jgi:60 kDa SS-A/Ro ribonucleoprotein